MPPITRTLPVWYCLDCEDYFSDKKNMASLRLEGRCLSCSIIQDQAKQEKENKDTPTDAMLKNIFANPLEILDI